MNPLTDLAQILIEELGKTSVMFLAWFKNSKLSGLTLKTPGKAEIEFKELEPRFKSAKTRFKLSAGLNLETFDTILSGTNHI